MTDTISKSAKKRQFKQVEKAAGEVVDLSDKDLSQLPCNEELKSEIRATRKQKGGARKRQIKYVAKLMREESVEDILTFLAEKKGSKLKLDRAFHEAERLRDVMINEAIRSHDLSRQEGLEWDMDWYSSEIDGCLHKYPALAEQEIRKAIYSYVKTRNRLHYRELFRMVKAAIDNSEIDRKVS